MKESEITEGQRVRLAVRTPWETQTGPSKGSEGTVRLVDLKSGAAYVQFSTFRQGHGPKGRHWWCTIEQLEAV